MRVSILIATVLTCQILVSQASAQQPTPARRLGPTTSYPRVAAKPTKSVAQAPEQATVDRRVKTLEGLFSQQQALLQSRLKQAAAARERALEKNDFAALEKIEVYERKAFALYEQEVARLQRVDVKTEGNAKTPQATAQRRPAPQRPQDTQANKPETKSRKFWLFGR